MKNFLKNVVFLAIIAVSIVSCKKKQDDPAPVTENELITTVRLTFTRTDANYTPVTPAEVVVATWKDMDGAGAGVPVVGGITLKKSAFYTLSTEFLNETKNPVENINTEINAEKEDHQVFFIRASDPFFGVVYTDFDANAKPVGLQTQIRTNASASGTLQVVLRHEPNKNAANVSTGDITNAGGSTDVSTIPAFNITLN